MFRWLRDLLNPPERYVYRVRVAEMKPNDVLVIDSEMMLADEAIQRITAQVRHAFGDHRCIVLDRGLSLTIVSETSK